MVVSIVMGPVDLVESKAWGLVRKEGLTVLIVPAADVVLMFGRATSNLMPAVVGYSFVKM